MITITEGLAELKTIVKRVEKKKEFILAHGCRMEIVKDPFAKEGSSAPAEIAKAMQSINDLCDRIVSIRDAIACANQETELTIVRI